MGLIPINTSLAESTLEAVRTQGALPKSWLSIHLVEMSAARMPSATPASASHKVSLITSLNTSTAWAPRAIRTPISCVRRAIV
jgi:hypothetical protein